MGNLPPPALAVMNSRIKKAKRDRENHVEDPIEGVPGDNQSQHGIAGLLDPIQIPVRRVFSHKQHDPGMPVKRRDGKKVECPEEQIQDKQDAQRSGGKSWVGGVRRCRHVRVVDGLRRLEVAAAIPTRMATPASNISVKFAAGPASAIHADRRG